MRKYRIPYKGKIYGFVVVEANTLEEAKHVCCDGSEWIDEVTTNSKRIFDMRDIEEYEE